MRSLKKWLSHTISLVGWEDHYRISLFFVFLGLTIPSFLFFGIKHLIGGNNTEAFSNCITSGMLILMFFLFLNIKQKIWIYFFSTLLILLSLGYLFYQGGEYGSRMLWFYFIPIAAYFLLNIFLANIFTVLSYIILAIIFLKIPILGYLPYDYPEVIRTRFLITYSMIVMFSFIFEYIRSRFRSEIKAEHNKLTDAFDQIELLSITDPLTQCYNRRHLIVTLEKELERSQRYFKPLSIIMCDLDYFKKINDVYGHTAGDTVLIAFSRFLLNSVRQKIDSVFRYGGEEFILILPETDKGRSPDF